MKIIIHRINTIEKLNAVPLKYGVEVDIRTYRNELILNHNPFIKGERLSDYLDNFKHKFLIANVKESGLENILKLEFKKRNIKNFFLLDVEFPYFFKYLKKKNNNLAIRFSEFESIETIKHFKNKIQWVWIDTPNQFPVNKKNYKILNSFKKCLVCPERWGRPNDIFNIKSKIKKNNFKIDAVMTSLNYARLWEKN